MSDDHSDVGAMEHEADHADMTDDGEVKLVWTSEDIRKPPGAINPGTMALDRVFWSLVVQGWELRRIWVNPERIGEDLESRVRFFFRAPTAPTECQDRVTHAGGLRKAPGFPGLRWTAAGRWDTN